MGIKKFAKSLLIGSLVVVLGSALTACGSTQTSNEGATNQTEGSQTASSQDDTNKENVEINIFQYKVEIAEALQAAIDLYMSENPNVKINLQTVGGGDDYNAALSTKMQSGEEPTIFNIGGPQDTKDWMEKLEDLSDQDWVSVAGSTLGAVTMDSKVYGLPYAVEGYGIVYNKKIFEAGGIDTAAIVDLASMDKAFGELDAKIKAGDLKDQFPYLEAVVEMPAKEKWIIGLHASNIFLNQEFATAVDAFNAKTVEFTKGDDYKAYIDMLIKYSPNSETPAKATAVDYDTQVGQGLAIERVAAVQQGNWIYSDVNSIDPDVAANLDFLPVGGDCIPLGVPYYWAVNTTKSDAEKQAAKEFLDWLYMSDEGKNIVVNEFHFIPPFTGYDNYPAADPLGQSIMKYQAADKTTPWIFMGYPTAWSDDAMGTDVQKYLSGEMTWDEALADAKAQWEAARK